MTTSTEPIDVEALRLHVDAIDAKPRDYDWSEHPNIDIQGGLGEDRDIGWRFWEAPCPDDGDEATCDGCGEPIQYNADLDGGTWVHAGQDTPSASCDDDDIEPFATPDYEYASERCEGPMMNYWYPLAGLDSRDAAKIADLPLCIVEVDGETGLALTGGGMDLSWEICEAYIKLGSYPPFHFASQLPRMAWGGGLSDRKRLVLAVCKESCRIVARWAERGVERLDETEAWYAERA